MKFSTILFLISQLLFNEISINAQTTFDIRVTTDRRETPTRTSRNFIISNLGYHQLDGNYEKATEQQLGVIGNDFVAPVKIGTAPAETISAIDTWFPIDEFKRTFVGRHNVIFSMDLNDGSAMDDDWNVRIIVPEDNSLIRDNKDRLSKIGETMFKILGLDIKLESPEFHYPLTYINGEIDIKQVNKIFMMEYQDYTPKAWIDHAGMYGPWVYDRGWRQSFAGDILDNKLLGVHGTFIEIHPMEQLWWTEKKPNGRIYHLNMANDNSGRFNERSDFDEGSGSLKSVWQTNPMIHTYYIPFNVPIRSEPVKFIISPVSENNLTKPYTDGTEHNLVYRNRNLINIKEPPGDIIKIDFINTGIDPVAILKDIKDTLIKGFIKIEASIGKAAGDYAGNLFLKVRELNPNLNPRYESSTQGEKRGKVQVTLKNIKCTGVDDGDPQEDIMGFIGVRVSSANFYPVDANQLPDNSDSPLLWSKLDGEAQKSRSGESLVLNKSFIYSLPIKGSTITLVADLDEDDGNGDNNKTMLDDPKLSDADDKLEAKFEANTTDNGKTEAGAVFKPIKLKELSLNQPITRKMYFGSGGTKVEIEFEIILIEQSGSDETPMKNLD